MQSNQYHDDCLAPRIGSGRAHNKLQSSMFIKRKSETELNGLRGTLVGISPDRTRYLVGIDGRTLAVRRKNMHIEATHDDEIGEAMPNDDKGT